MSDGPTFRPETRSRRDQGRLVVVCVVVALGVLFAALNTQTVKIHWIVTTTNSPLIVAMILMALLGFVAGFVTSHIRARRRRRR